MAKNPDLVFFGLFLIGMLFVPPSIPFMVPEAEAAEDTIEMTETGFSQTTITITVGDSLRFLNTHVKANGNIEPHCISEPASIAATHLSCHLLSDSTLSHTYYSGEINFGNPGTEEFHDSFYWYAPINNDGTPVDPDDAAPLLVTILAPPDTTPPVISFVAITTDTHNDMASADPNDTDVLMDGQVKN